MESGEIIETATKTYNVKESIFKDNKGIQITCDNSNLNVESCLFFNCSKERGGSIYYYGSSNIANVSKICGKEVFLSSTSNCGIFYFIFGKQTFDHVSFYDHYSSSNSRDSLNHETGNQLIGNVNVSHVNNFLRGFAWFSPKKGNNVVLNFAIAYNITCNCELLQVYESSNAIFNYMSIVSCASLSYSTITQSSLGNYLFASRVAASLSNCLMRNNKFVNLFYGTPNLLSCDIETKSVDSISTKFIDMNPNLGIYLNTFLCQASGKRGCVKTRNVCRSQPNNFCFFLIFLLTYIKS